MVGLNGVAELFQMNHECSVANTSKSVIASAAHVPSEAWGKQSPRVHRDCIAAGVYRKRSVRAACNDIPPTEQIMKPTTEEVLGKDRQAVPSLGRQGIGSSPAMARH